VIPGLPGRRPPRSLAGARVLLTGASSGVGVAAARAFAAEGADLALVARGREGLERTARRVEREGVAAHVFPVDVSDREALDEAVNKAVAALGGLDVLVVNVASVVFGPFREVDPEAFDRVTAVTYTGSVNTIRSALPHLERSHGTIVVTGSANSRAPLPALSSYSAAKHALRGLVNTLDLELRAERVPVRVATVHPGAVDTPLWRQVTSTSGYLPRTPPLALSADAVAAKLVEAARSPRPVERSVGIDALALVLLSFLARPVADAMLIALHHWYRGGRVEAPPPGSLWRAVGTGESSGGLLRRDLRGLFGLARLPLALLRGADPEADVMGSRAIAAAEPAGIDDESPEAQDRVA
jgi:NAD(P)-dependent dehydrogenase (short-subunit alcohol dehydrogenase family)